MDHRNVRKRSNGENIKKLPQITCFFTQPTAANAPCDIAGHNAPAESANVETNLEALASPPPPPLDIGSLGEGCSLSAEAEQPPASQSDSETPIQTAAYIVEKIF